MAEEDADYLSPGHPWPEREEATERSRADRSRAREILREADAEVERLALEALEAARARELALLKLERDMAVALRAWGRAVDAEARRLGLELGEGVLSLLEGLLPSRRK